jgi:hypothetical protein
MPSAGILASRKRFQISREIINAFFPAMGFDRAMKRRREQPVLPFRLALVDGRVLTLANNQSAGKL